MSASGPSGLKAEHLLLAYPYIQNLLLIVLTSIINGCAPRWLADARLIALRKKDDGIRPIAIGETLRRIAAKALYRTAVDALPPLARQYAQRHDGCLSVATLIRSAIELNPATCVLSIDIRNAYNTISRDAVINAARDSPFGLYTQWAYGTRSRLRHGNVIIDSCTGVQQGDPLGPALFAITLAKAVKSAQTTFANQVLDFWYADDGALIGSATDVIQAFESFRTSLQSIGLIFNFEKCKLWLPNANLSTGSCPVQKVNGTSETDALVILGFPVAGTEAALRAFAQTAVNEATQVLSYISLLQHAQGEANLLRNCGPTNRLRYLLRFGLKSDMRLIIYQADASTFEHEARIKSRLPPQRSQRVYDGNSRFELLQNLDYKAMYRKGLDSVASSVHSAIKDEVAQGLNSSYVQQLLKFALSRNLPVESEVKPTEGADCSSVVSGQRCINKGAANHRPSIDSFRSQYR